MATSQLQRVHTVALRKEKAFTSVMPKMGSRTPVIFWWH